MQGLPGQEGSQFKVPLIGDANVGKTSIVSRYTSDNFVPNARPTVGVSTTTIAITVNKQTVELSVWDTAGQERFRSLVPLYTRHAAALVLIFDISSQQSFTALDSWLTKLTGEMAVICPIVVCGNKTDLPNAVPQQTVKQWAEDHSVIAHFTSAVSGVGVSELFQTIAELVSNAPKENPFGASPVLEQAQKDKCC
jgi:small GTP-binding protein